MNRRDFLRTTGTFVLGASVLGPAAATGCGSDAAKAGTYSFPQGVASGDPRATSLVLWTRVEATTPGAAAIDLDVEVATDAGFKTRVASRTVQATPASDGTVRVIVTGLTAGTAYYYRFTAGVDSVQGRTRTAAAKDADVPVHFAWVSCQDFVAGNYGGYRQLIADDDARAEADRVQFVVHLGDFIYETVGSGFQQAVDENFAAITPQNTDGSARTLAALPSGSTFARTLADYRHLYRSYLGDADLRAARARWPFIQIWDDHDFSNDSWQSMANYDDKNSTDEPSQTRKVAANQAWSEYVPAQLTGADGVVPAQAKDFAPATVTDAPFTEPNADNFVAEPNNAAAVGSMTIYRSFRFGKHLELVMTDLRSYRSDHAVPEELVLGNPLIFDVRNVMPMELVNTLDAGKTANGGAPPDSVQGFTNPRKTSPAGTMLGARQKQWWKDTIKGSDATWKVWGTSVFLMRAVIKKEGLELLSWDRIFAADSWDGYNAERKELLGYVKAQSVKNLVAICGDIHAQFAGLLMDDYDAAAPTPVGVELVAAGVTSNSALSFFESRTRQLPGVVRNVVTFDASSAGGAKWVENLNVTLLKGTVAAAEYAKTLDLAKGLAKADPTVNPHMKYADTNAQGYGLLSVTATQTTGTLVTINHPIRASGPQGPGILRSAKFVIPKDDPAAMTGPEITGTKPVPFT